MTKSVLIDVTQITPVVDGLSIYIINLLKHLPSFVGDDLHLGVLVDPDLDRPDLWAALKAHPFRIFEGKIAPIGVRRDIQMRKFFKEHGKDFDLFHSTSNNFPSGLKGGIATFHDLTWRRWFDDVKGIPGTRHLAVAYMSMVIRRAIRHAERSIAVSRSTANDLAEQFKLSPAQHDRTTPIHLGWEHLLDYPESSEGVSGLPEAGYIFFLGSNRVHKNLRRLLEAFELSLKDLPHGKSLLISGSSSKISPKVQAIVDRINARGERVRFTGYASNADIRRYYENADVFILPSLAEGFGIPVLEAFYFGTPLLAARTTSIPEVAGEAALYFDPFDTASIADALVRFYADPTLGQRLIELGRERLQAFSWRETARQTALVYRQCLA